MPLLQHLRVGVRGLRRAPGFSATAVLTLALGIGLATAVFAVADALLLRPLPMPAAERLVVLSGRSRDGKMENAPVGTADARELERRTTALERVAFTGYEGATAEPVRDGGDLTRLRRTLFTGDLFAVLGADPVIGRALRPEDIVRGAAPVAVLSHRAWRERFGGDPRAVGRRIEMHEDGVSYTIVGVMPRGLDYPRGTDFWAPLATAVPERNEPYVALTAVGRLAAGASEAQARDEMTALFGREGAAPWLRELRGAVHPLPQLLIGDTRPAVLVFAAAAALLLLITCIDVANLLLVRGLGRAREVAVRSALGARRSQVVGQLLVEHATLAVAGALLGILVAALAVRGFVALAPAGLPRLDEIALDGTALAAAIGIATISMLVFGVAPALAASRAVPADALRAGGRHGASRGARLASELLVVGQVALALVVLSAAGLLARSFVALQRAELSFDAEQLMVGELALRLDRYDTPARQRAMLDQLVPRLEALPGVRAVTPVVAVPFSGTQGWDGKLAAEGQTQEQATANPMLNMEVVTPSWFGTFAVPVRRGRAFTAADAEGAPPVIIVSEATARLFWPGADAVGRRMTLGGGPQQRTFTVVGVVPDTRYRDLRDARASVYFPLAQSFFPFVPTTLVLRTSVPPSDLAAALRRTIGEAAPGVELASASPFERFLEAPLAQPRLNALLLAAFAGAAVILAAVGLVGVVATMVRQRTRELGVRMALGASARDVGRLVLRRGLALAAAGTALGVAGALAVNRLLGAMLFEVSPTDVPTLAAVAVLLLVVAALASLVPARASTRIDPITALRAD